MDINRLNSIISKDKKTNPKYFIEVIKSDFYYLISNYFEVDFDNIKLDFDLVGNRYKLTITCDSDRIKLMRAIP